MMLQPFNSDDERTAPAFWVFERVLRQMSMRQLLQRFYDEFDANDIYTCLPISRVYNPEDKITGKRYFGFSNEQVVLFIYRRGFYVVIEKHWRLMEGPHATKLFYKSEQTKETLWVATLQLDECMFYNEDVVTNKLTEAILNRDFFQSDRTADEIIFL